MNQPPIKDSLNESSLTNTASYESSAIKLHNNNNSKDINSTSVKKTSASSSSSSLELSSNSPDPIDFTFKSHDMQQTSSQTTTTTTISTPIPTTIAITQNNTEQMQSTSSAHNAQQQKVHRREEGELENSDKKSSSESLSMNEGAPAADMRSKSSECPSKGASSGGGENFRLFKPLSSIVCLDDFESVAEKSLEKSIYDYYFQGSDDELTLQWNRSMIAHRYCLRPRVMCNVAQLDLTKYIFGDKLSLPIGVSPTAMQKMAHPDGELAMVRACDRINCLMILSFFSTTSLENVAKEAPICTKWQNIYILKQREISQNLINRAIRYGYRALVVTCDAPILGNRRRDVRNQFTLGKFTLENIEDSSVKSMRDHSSELFDPSLSWSDLADLKKSVGDTIRVIAKGIMTPEDAEMAIKAGVDAIFISNHGGRQLNGSPSTIEVLADIVEIVNKRCPVFVDGGFRTGADILKALALGADMVFLGRPLLWALAGYGEEGAFRALKMLEEELKKAMMLCGCTKLSEINSSLIWQRPYNVIKM